MKGFIPVFIGCVLQGVLFLFVSDCVNGQSVLEDISHLGIDLPRGGENKQPSEVHSYRNNKSFFSDDIDFAHHLISRSHFDEAYFALSNMRPETKSQKDSVNYYKGWLLYNQKSLSISASYLEQVSFESVFYEKSHFFAAYNYAFLGHTSKGFGVLDNLILKTKGADEMLLFQTAGLSLLERDLNQFDDISAQFGFETALLAQEQRKLMDYRNRISSNANKSPVLAGVFSAVIPGTGRMYAGKLGEGAASLLYIVAMSAVSYDMYNRFGYRNPLFIISATVGSLFYVGNIWGSVTAVTRTKNEFNYEMDQRILLDLHIPLRRFFP